LFQDGAWNPFSDVQKAGYEPIAECCELFRRQIPLGTVFQSHVNLGIALNYKRAEEFLFGGLKVPYALFLEDDMVLSPHYLEVTHRLLHIAIKQPAIGYVSAYGDFWA